MIYAAAVIMLIFGIYGLLYKNPLGGALVVGAVLMAVLHVTGAIAADKPIPFAIGSTPIGHAAPAKPVRKETDDEYIRRVSKPAPGKME